MLEERPCEDSDDMFDPIKAYVDVLSVNTAPVNPSPVMRTGHQLTASYDSIHERKRKDLESCISSSSIKESFESSYLKWLALAKIHQTMITILTLSLDNLDQLHTDIERIKKGPLAPLHQ